MDGERESSRDTKGEMKERPRKFSNLDQVNPNISWGCILLKLSFQTPVFLNPAYGPAQNSR